MSEYKISQPCYCLQVKQSHIRNTVSITDPFDAETETFKIYRRSFSEVITRTFCLWCMESGPSTSSGTAPLENQELRQLLVFRKNISPFEGGSRGMTSTSRKPV
jgi:hypothetical protein